MFCSTCGSPVQEGQKFCAVCGAMQAVPAAPVIPPEPAPAPVPEPAPVFTPPVAETIPEQPTPVYQANPQQEMYSAYPQKAPAYPNAPAYPQNYPTYPAAPAYPAAPQKPPKAPKPPKEKKPPKPAKASTGVLFVLIALVAQIAAFALWLVKSITLTLGENKISLSMLGLSTQSVPEDGILNGIGLITIAAVLFGMGLYAGISLIARKKDKTACAALMPAVFGLWNILSFILLFVKLTNALAPLYGTVEGDTAAPAVFGYVILVLSAAVIVCGVLAMLVFTKVEKQKKAAAAPQQ